MAHSSRWRRLLCYPSLPPLHSASLSPSVSRSVSLPPQHARLHSAAYRDAWHSIQLSPFVARATGRACSCCARSHECLSEIAGERSRHNFLSASSTHDRGEMTGIAMEFSSRTKKAPTASPARGPLAQGGRRGQTADRPVTVGWAALEGRGCGREKGLGSEWVCGRVGVALGALGAHGGREGERERTHAQRSPSLSPPRS